MSDHLHVLNWYTVKSKLSNFKQNQAKYIKDIRKICVLYDF